MKKYKMICIMILLSCLCTFKGFAAENDAILVAENNMAVAAEQNLISKNVMFRKPEWTNKNYAIVYIDFVFMPEKVYARTEHDSEWFDITNSKNFKITKNGLLHVKSVIGENEATQSEYIECFDHILPEVNYVINEQRLNVSAKDSDSGIAAIYINENKITQFSSGSTDNIAMTDYTIPKNEQSIMIYAEDKAGNLSKTITLKAASNQSGQSSSTQTGAVGNASITITAPELTNKDSALVKVAVKGSNIDEVEAKTSRNGTWFSITSTMDFTVTNNSDVYVRTIDVNGIETTVSQRIDCFDRDPPIATMIQDGNSINILANDSLSGVQTLYVNGKPYNSDSTSINITESKTFIVQARDKAGNLSPATRLDAVYKNESATENTTTNTQPVTVTDQPIPEPTVDNVETQTGTIYNVTLGDGSQYTLEELQNLGVPIYLMAGVDEQTLRSIIQEVYSNQTSGETIAHELPIIADEVPEELTEMVEAENEEEPTTDKKKSSPVGVVIVAVVVLAAGLIAFLYLKRRNAKYSKDDLYESEYDPDRNAYGDDDDFEDEGDPLELDIAY